MFGGGPLSLGPASRPLRSAVMAGRQFARKPVGALVMKAVPTACGFGFGDGLTQVMNRKPGDRYNFARTAQMASIGLVIATPILFGFNIWMDGNIMGGSTSALATGVKFVLDQIVGCIFWQCGYLTINPSYRAQAAELLRATQANLRQSSRELRQQLRLQRQQLPAM